MTNLEKISELTERQTHYETMSFSIFDAQLLEYMIEHRNSLSMSELEYWDNARYYE